MGLVTIIYAMVLQVVKGPEATQAGEWEPSTGITTAVSGAVDDIISLPHHVAEVATGIIQSGMHIRSKGVSHYVPPVRR